MQTRGGQERAGFLDPAVAVHVYPWVFMAVVALLVMHVQVATRMLSVCPAHHWCMAHLARRGDRGVRRRRWRLMLWAACLAYTVLGGLLFPNFYPWT